MDSPAANQLPEVDSLPDGFVNSSAEPLVPSTPSLEQEHQLSDYKEEKLIELDSRPEIVVTDSLANEGTTGNTESTRTFPVQFSEDVSCHSEKLKEPEKDCLHSSDVAVIKSEERQEGSPDGIEHAKEMSQSSEKANSPAMDAQTDHGQGVSSSQILEASRKVDTSEVKRKSTKRTFKSEKEFLEFTLKYQQVLTERDAAVAVRDRLESLCRELQRQNKILMDECKRVSTEGQNLRLDLSNKFQDAIKEVSHKLEEQKDDCLSQLKENEMLKNKLNQLADQYALTEQQYAQKLKQKTLELQIADLKIQQHEEKLVQEQSQMKLYAEKVSQLLETEKNLRLQLTADGEKFLQFQDALVKSNEVFETFKQEIDKMAKSIKELKKENAFLKSKSEKSDITLIELAGERENLKKQLDHLKKQLEKTKKQKEKLESLCRSLQAERKQNSTEQISPDTVPLL